jgi:tetratricopeptide (TPR) repeat protein
MIGISSAKVSRRRRLNGWRLFATGLAITAGLASAASAGLAANRTARPAAALRRTLQIPNFGRPRQAPKAKQASTPPGLGAAQTTIAPSTTTVSVPAAGAPRGDDPWSGVLFNSADPWTPGAAPPPGSRRVYVPGAASTRGTAPLAPAAPVPPLAANEKPNPERVQALYRQALVEWAAGQSDAAEAHLAALEIAVVSDADSGSVKRLLRSEEKVIHEVAGDDLEVLLPIARLHFEVYRRYLAENAKGRTLVENHSRAMVRDLAILYRQQSGSEGSILVASHLLTTLGDLQQRGAQHQAAAQLYTEAATLDPHNVVPALSLGVIYEKFGQYQSAAEWLRKVIVLEPKNAEARLRLAINLGRIGKAAEGRKLLEGLTGGTDDSWVVPLAFQELARIDERLDAFSKAEAALRAGLVRFPESVRLRLQLAAVLDREGKVREGRQVVEEIPALTPGPEDTARFVYNSSAGDRVAVSRNFFEENATSRLRVLAQVLARGPLPPDIPGAVVPPGVAVEGAAQP